MYYRSSSLDYYFIRNHKSSGLDNLFYLELRVLIHTLQICGSGLFILYGTSGSKIYITDLRVWMIYLFHWKLQVLIYVTDLQVWTIIYFMWNLRFQNMYYIIDLQVWIIYIMQNFRFQNISQIYRSGLIIQNFRFQNIYITDLQV